MNGLNLSIILFKMVIDILTGSQDKTHYTLDFPEKHLPNNMSFVFWEKVSKLMEIDGWLGLLGELSLRF